MVFMKSFSNKFWGTAIAITSVFAGQTPGVVRAESPQSGTITNLTMGDRACYVTLRNEAGDTTTEFAAFNICEQNLIGKKVQLTYEAGNIIAESCYGDLDCGISETVMLITAVKVMAGGQKADGYPPFLNKTEIAQLETDREAGRNGWFGLAGLNKVDHPPQLAPELLAFRQYWKTKDPAIAPFLGLWHNDESTNNRHYVSIFPSLEANHVCVLEFKPEWSIKLSDNNNDVSKDVISPGIFSFSRAKVGSAQLRSAEFRAHELAIARTAFGVSADYPVELLPLVNEQNETMVLAAATVPQLPPDLPDSQAQYMTSQLLANSCVMSSQ